MHMLDLSNSQAQRCCNMIMLQDRTCRLHKPKPVSKRAPWCKVSQRYTWTPHTPDTDDCTRLAAVSRAQVRMRMLCLVRPDAASTST
jgi:hypothetical protein